MRGWPHSPTYWVPDCICQAGHLSLTHLLCAKLERLGVYWVAFSFLKIAGCLKKKHLTGEFLISLNCWAQWEVLQLGRQALALSSVTYKLCGFANKATSAIRQMVCICRANCGWLFGDDSGMHWSLLHGNSSSGEACGESGGDVRPPGN